MSTKKLENLEVLNGPILIVDDEPEICVLIKEILVDLGVTHMMVANSGPEALDLCLGVVPSLVISDFKMPEMDGLELLTELQRRYGSVTFVLVAAYVDREVAIKGLNAGVTQLIEKPFKPESLAEEISNILNSKIEKILEEIQETEQILEGFVEEATDILEDLPNSIIRLEDGSGGSSEVDLVFRQVHTLKGGSGSVPLFAPVAEIAHAAESLLGFVRDGKLIATSDIVEELLTFVDLVRVAIDQLVKDGKLNAETVSEIANGVSRLEALKDGSGKSSGAVLENKKANSRITSVDDKDKGVLVPNEKLDDFMKLSGELIVLKNSLRSVFGCQVGSPKEEERFNEKILDFSYSLDKITDQLQGLIMDVRKVRLSYSLKKFPRIVRQASKEVQKDVKYIEKGLDLEVDKNVARMLSTSLVHLIRNAVDHGLESSEERVRAGKPAQGQIILSCMEREGKVWVSIKDDGGGIDANKIWDKAASKGLVSADQRALFSENDIFDLLFVPGFSTAEAVSNLSGRGVGMDAVKTGVLALNGRIVVESEMGIGTEILIEIPIPKSVMVEKSIIARSEDIFLAIPQAGIKSILSGKDMVFSDFKDLTGFQFDGKTLPLVRHSFLQGKTYTIEKWNDNSKSIVVVNYKRNSIGVLVDNLEGQLEAVVRPFNPLIKDMRGFKGTTILGDDSLAYVLSPQSFVSEYLEGDLEGVV